ncbi:hypothetical protein [Nostoc sp. DSM 114159]|jgi:hypothetical protein
MNGNAEKFYPIVLGFFLAILVYVLLQGKALPSVLKDVFSAAITISSISIGFLATAMSILFTIGNSYILDKIKQNGAFNRLINYFMDAVKWCFIVAIFSFICLFFELKTMQGIQSAIFALWIFCSITSLLSSYRVIDVFADILKSTANTKI